MTATVFINEILFALIEGFTLFLGFVYLMDKTSFFKENKFKTAICIVAFICFSYWAAMHVDHSIRFILMFTFNTCLFGIITMSNFYASIVSYMMVNVVYALTEVGFLLVFLNIINEPVSEAMNNPDIKMMSLMIVRPLQLILFFALSHLRIKNYFARFSIFSRKNYAIAYMLLLLISMISFMVAKLGGEDTILSFTVMGLIMLSTLYIGIRDFFERLGTINIKNQFQLQKEYIRSMELVMDAIRKEKHDYANQLSTLIAMCLNKGPDTLDKVEFYARRLLNGSDVSSNYKFYNTGNRYLDGLLAVKSNKAAENGIYLDIDFDAPLRLLDIDEIDLANIIGNIVDNAFDAVLEIKEGKRVVSLYGYKENDSYKISISNNGPGIPEASVKKIFEKKFSTKAKGEGERGFGLFIVSELVNQYRGKVEVSSIDSETEFLISFKISNGEVMQHAHA